MPPAPTDLLPTPDAATYIGVKAQTLRVWRGRGCGPAFVRLGTGPSTRAAYRRAELDAWLTSHTFKSTAAETVALLLRRASP